MKLIRAQFKNFRLLHDLTLDFSTDKTLTVIRAENESGKTTIFTGLQWALYGDDALPQKGKEYRIHPIDWDASDGTQIPISVDVEFEIKRFGRRGSGETKKQYRIIRAGHETLNGHRNDVTVKLFELTNRGSVPIESPEAEIRDILPRELREVFFTDGDRALSFIENVTPTRTKRANIEKAIRSLLGLDVIEAALGHVKKTTSAFNKDAKSFDSDKKVTQAAEKLEEVETTSKRLKHNIGNYESKIAELEENIQEIQKKIDAALLKGNREELKLDIEETEGEVEQLDKKLSDAAKEHSRLFRSLSLSHALLAPVLKKSLGKLSELHTQGKIPSATIPVLEECLIGTTCICGESLDLQTIEGKHRRENIQALIDESRHADALQSKLTELYYGSRNLQLDAIANDKRWIAEYDKIAEEQGKLKSKRDEQGKKLKALEAQAELIPDSNIQKLRATEKELTSLWKHISENLTRAEAKLEGLTREYKRLAAKRDNHLRQQREGARILARLDVASDVQSLLENSYDRITNEEMRKVSRQMNEIFLKMIGAEPEQGAMIQKAEISENFDILVYAPDNRELNPERDLNGASRRALTLAFILALTKVSGVDAPNVIDTPLGMMSGFVKQAVLKNAIRESAQLILFLTRTEIADCEEILDDEAGRVITLTNSVHYPKMLVNKPQEKERKIIRCECHHRTECRLCKRRIDVEEEGQPIS